VARSVVASSRLPHLVSRDYLAVVGDMHVTVGAEIRTIEVLGMEALQKARRQSITILQLTMRNAAFQRN
jgi:hypothetical protein